MAGEDNNIAEAVRASVHLHMRVRIIAYCLIFFISLGIVAYHIWLDGSGIFIPILALFVGAGIGITISRMHHITWDRGAKQVISRLDAVGMLILIIYIAFALKRGEIVGQFVHGPAVAAASFALLSGIMAGRILGITHKVASVLNEQEVIE